MKSLLENELKLISCHPPLWYDFDSFPMKTKKNYRRYGIPPELELTDRLGSVVGQRKKKRMLPVLFFPFRLMAAAWHWLLETKPKKDKQKHFRMPPPGLD